MIKAHWCISEPRVPHYHTVPDGDLGLHLPTPYVLGGVSSMCPLCLTTTRCIYFLPSAIHSLRKVKHWPLLEIPDGGLSALESSHLLSVLRHPKLRNSAEGSLDGTGDMCAVKLRSSEAIVMSPSIHCLLTQQPQVLTPTCNVLWSRSGSCLPEAGHRGRRDCRRDPPQ